MLLKTDIKNALDAISNKDKAPEELREQYAEAIATAIKNALQTWISKGVPIPQDGGSGLKTTLTSAINSL